MPEFNIHNVRFYDFEPKSIQCMAFEDDTKRLALSRSDSSIEIWNCTHRPFLQLVIPASDEGDASVEGLSWCNGRLFSVGLHGFLVEYNLSLCTVKSQTAVTGGPTWCVAISPDKKTIAAGTEEGYVCLFDVYDDSIMYNRTLEKQEGRILSISWHRDGNYIVTGSINCVRLWSLKEGRVTRCSFAHGKRQEIIVWCVTILDDMTIVSGDSRGHVCFWNSNIGTLTESVQTHKADVLCLAVEPSGTTVCVAGVDPLIVKVCKIQTGGKEGRKTRWISSHKFRHHSHDIRALAMAADGRLFSGGIDTVLVVTSYPPKVVLKIPAPLYPGYLSVGPKSESFLLRYKERLELWRLGKPKDVSELQGNNVPIAEDRVKMLELQCDERESFQWCALSREGLWIAYIVSQTIKIFQFFPPKMDNQVSIRKLRVKSKEIESSRQLLWLSEGKLASVTLTGTIQIIDISDMQATVENVLKPKNCVLSMICSVDGNILVVVDSQQVVTAYDLIQGVDISLPKYDSGVTAVTINENTKDILVVYSDATMKEFSMKDKRYTEYCSNYMKAPFKNLLTNNAAIRNASYDSRDSNLILLHDDTSIIVLDKKGKQTDIEPQQKSKFRKKKKGRKSLSGDNFGKFTFVRRSHQLLYFSHFKDEFVLSVELDPVQLHDRLPPTLKVKKYGGN